MYTMFEIFNEALDSVFQDTTRTYSLPIDISLPGVRKEDLKITLEKGWITVTAKDRKGKAFTKTILANGIKADDIQAKFEDGLLELKLKKQEQQKTEVKIE